MLQKTRGRPQSGSEESRPCRQGSTGQESRARAGSRTLRLHREEGPREESGPGSGSRARPQSGPREKGGAREESGSGPREKGGSREKGPREEKVTGRDSPK